MNRIIRRTCYNISDAIYFLTDDLSTDKKEIKEKEEKRLSRSRGISRCLKYLKIIIFSDLNKI